MDVSLPDEGAGVKAVVLDGRGEGKQRCVEPMLVRDAGGRECWFERTEDPKVVPSNLEAPVGSVDERGLGATTR